MITRNGSSSRIAAFGAAAVLALLVAACGSSSSGQSTKTGSTKPASGSAGLTISTAKGSMGTYLVGSSGRALYMWVADHGGRSSCSGSCAQNWPPLTASSTPKTAGGVNAGDLGTTVRSDGSKQVTYNGHPLYYFIGDSGSGMTSGEGSDGFGAKWWLMTPSGKELMSGGSSSSSTSSSGGSNGGY